MKSLLRAVPTCFILLLSAGFVFAGDPASDLGLFPGVHDLFKPLQADPNELQFAVRAVIPVSRRVLGEAAFGDYLGLYRWALPGDVYMQLSLGGGVFGRFDLAERSNSLQVVDFYAKLPLDLRKGKWSGRVMPYHNSSHLGDDYLKEHGLVAEKHTWDNLEGLASYDISPLLRIYSGYTYVVRTLPGNLGRHAVQGGFEMYSPWWGHTNHARLYWANDFQSWTRVHWNPMFSSQLGVKMVKSPEVGRGISAFIEYIAGHQPQGQLFQQEESRWDLGLKYEVL